VSSACSCSKKERLGLFLGKFEESAQEAFHRLRAGGVEQEVAEGAERIFFLRVLGVLLFKKRAVGIVLVKSRRTRPGTISSIAGGGS